MAVRGHARLVAVIVASVALLVGAAGTGAAVSRAPSAPPPRPAGKAGTAITLIDQVQLDGYDVAVDRAGTTYIGWIASTGSAANRTVYLCVIPRGGTGCSGGILTTASLGISSADGLKVLVLPNGTVTLVWFHDTDASVSGPLGGKVATSTLQGGALSPAVDRAGAPSFGSLADAEVGPDGQVWAVTALGSGSGNDLQVHPGLGTPPTTLTPPWLVGKARLAFDHGNAVLVIDKYGAVSEPVHAASRGAGGTWTSFAAVPGTWNVGGAFDVAAVRSTVRLVASVNNATYYPRVAAWTGARFGPFTYTGDRDPCPEPSHDLFPDSSGRLADTTFECSKVTVVNQPTGGRAAIARFSTTNTPAGGDPQIGTSPRGTGWVVWGELSQVSGTTLKAVPVRLPALARKVSHRSPAGRVTVTGPVSCMPAVDLAVGVKGKGRSGWSVVSRSLRLDGANQGRTLRGASLRAGTTHALVGKVVFAKGGSRKTVTATVGFRACADPVGS